MHVGDGAMRGKEIAQFVFGGGERQISYVQFHNIFFEVVTEPFPTTEFQITTEKAPSDDSPRNQLEQSSHNVRPD